MDPLFDRVTNLIRSLLTEDESDPRRPRFSDFDEQQAWQELNDFLGEDDEDERSEHGRAGASAGADKRRSRPGAPPEDLREDFANLRVSFGAPLTDCRDAYKKLLIKYHPDRYGHAPDKQATATEISQRLTQSYQRIREYYSQL
jgi:DnaJ-domain-containing protein 1